MTCHWTCSRNSRPTSNDHNTSPALTTPDCTTPWTTSSTCITWLHRDRSVLSYPWYYYSYFYPHHSTGTFDPRYNQDAVSVPRERRRRSDTLPTCVYVMHLFEGAPWWDHGASLWCHTAVYINWYVSLFLLVVSLWLCRWNGGNVWHDVDSGCYYARLSVHKWAE